MPLDHRLARVVDFVVLDVERRWIFLDLAQILIAFLHPLVEADRLILQGMRQLVGHHRFLFLHGNPIQQVDGLRFGIVVAGDLLAQQRHQQLFQIEIARQEPKLFQHQLRPLQLLHVFILHVPGQVSNHFVAAGQATLDLLLDGQSRPLAVEGENLIDGVKQFLRFARCDFDLFFRLRRSYLLGGDILFRLFLILILLPLSLRSLILRACRRCAQPHKQHNRKKRPQKPRAKQFDDIH